MVQLLKIILERILIWILVELHNELSDKKFVLKRSKEHFKNSIQCLFSWIFLKMGYPNIGSGGTFSS